mmetsp:Transcript_9473/g.15515  ORF Transcript_9473/g.15515 Transcript_9473/m.15515 type:complete len:86 (+) Transcript_9473:960-1217(+)
MSGYTKGEKWIHRDAALLYKMDVIMFEILSPATETIVHICLASTICESAYIHCDQREWYIYGSCLPYAKAEYARFQGHNSLFFPI